MEGRDVMQFRRFLKLTDSCAEAAPDLRAGEFCDDDECLCILLKFSQRCLPGFEWSSRQLVLEQLERARLHWQFSHSLFAIINPVRHVTVPASPTSLPMRMESQAFQCGENQVYLGYGPVRVCGVRLGVAYWRRSSTVLDRVLIFDGTCS